MDILRGSKTLSHLHAHSQLGNKVILSAFLFQLSSYINKCRPAPLFIAAAQVLRYGWAGSLKTKSLETQVFRRFASPVSLCMEQGKNEKGHSLNPKKQSPPKMLESELKALHTLGKHSPLSYIPSPLFITDDWLWSRCIKFSFFWWKASLLLKDYTVFVMSLQVFDPHMGLQNDNWILSSFQSKYHFLSLKVKKKKSFLVDLVLFFSHLCAFFWLFQCLKSPLYIVLKCWLGGGCDVPYGENIVR